MPEMNDYAKVRKWQVQFEVHRPFATLPLPTSSSRKSALRPFTGWTAGCAVIPAGSFRSRSAAAAASASPESITR